MKLRLYLATIAILSVVAWQFPVGRQVLYPFTLFATYAHEMGHGLTAVLLGGQFDALEMFLDGSGFAKWRGQGFGGMRRALVALGGLVGPSFLGALLLFLARSQGKARRVLWFMAAVLGLSLFVVVRNLFGAGFVLGCIAVALLAAKFLPPRGAQIFVQCVGVQLCVSVFRDVGYMFSMGAIVDGQARPSDSQAMAEALFLPYWFWGALAAVTSFGMAAWGLFGGERRQRPVKKS